jgi:molybdopterin-guanine dinucleotide biosynthesis adapter protein
VTQKIIGVAGFKNAGKTTLVEKLVVALTQKGYRISTVKHAHHSFDIDHEGRDSFRHRKAGATEVAVVSKSRWAIIHELREETEPSLADILSQLAHCDLVIVEGYKRDSHDKIEVRNLALDHPVLAGDDPTIVAVAATDLIAGSPVPVFDRDDVTALSDFIVRHCKMTATQTSFRRADKHDADAVRQLTRGVYAKWVPIIGREPMPMKADYEKAVSDHWVDLLERDGKLVGLIEMIPKSDHLHIENIAVAEIFQAQGIGRVLMDRAFTLAKAARLQEVRLLTNKAFESNIQMYDHFGFENYAETAFPDGGTTVYFRKPVS